jgi:hypothetical protein
MGCPHSSSARGTRKLFMGPIQVGRRLQPSRQMRADPAPPDMVLLRRRYANYAARLHIRNRDALTLCQVLWEPNTKRW